MIWNVLLRRAALEFGIAPASFWSLSLKEWRALTTTGRGAEALSRSGLDALLAAHPDVADGDDR